jgi:hypothetical protein
MAPGYAAQFGIFFVNLDELDEVFDAEVGERLGHGLRQQRRRWQEKEKFGATTATREVQKETQERKQRAAFQVQENSSQFMQMLFQSFEHVRQDLKA